MFVHHARKSYRLVIWVLLVCGVSFLTGCATQRSATSGDTSARKDTSISQAGKPNPPFQSYRHLGHTHFKRSTQIN